MKLLEGSRVNGICEKLNECIYDLKQALREWDHQLIDFLTPYRFIVSNFDPCILMFKSNNNTYYNNTNNILNNTHYSYANNILNNTHYNDTNNILFIAIYINNLLLFGSKGLVIDNVKDLLKLEFKVTDLGDLH